MFSSSAEALFFCGSGAADFTGISEVFFAETADFGHVLRLELRRMRRTGAAIIITTRLTAAVSDLIIRMKRLGPNVRLYFVTYKTEDPERGQLALRMQQAGVEVNYVTPQGGEPV